MKLFKDYKHANIGMVHDPSIKTALADLAAESRIDTVVETGTHIGLGSTTLLARAFGNQPTQIHTIEANYESYRKARGNLRKYRNVRCHYGCSARLAQARDFIVRDPAILNHHHYPAIFIDDTEDPVKFYSREVEGLLAVSRGRLRWWSNLFRPLFKEDLLAVMLKRHRGSSVLVVLDSAGGIGKLEFEITKELMSSVEYCLLLDDTHHLKHFRSVEEIRADNHWRILASNDVHGWMLARYRPDAPR